MTCDDDEEMPTVTKISHHVMKHFSEKGHVNCYQHDYVVCLLLYLLLFDP